jgi:hypothetical protein
MSPESRESRRSLRIVALVVCLCLAGHAREAVAQTSAQLGVIEARDLAKACGRTGRVADCIAAVRGRLARVADAVLAELQAAPAPTQPAAVPAKGAGRSESRVLWDGTFAHPDAPSFYTLKSYVPAGVSTSEAACAQLPPSLGTDRQLLLKLVCNAERELLAGGAGRWPDETREFEALRKLFAACLPATSSGARGCGGP